MLDETQAVFFKLILKNKQFSLLRFLLQFHCFHDNIELAEVLLKLGTADKSKFKGNKIRFMFDRGRKSCKWVLETDH